VLFDKGKVDVMIKPDHRTSDYLKPKGRKLNKTDINTGFTKNSFKFGVSLNFDLMVVEQNIGWESEEGKLL
jgi:hypothetical protein